jgi:hypothetical protein
MLQGPSTPGSPPSPTSYPPANCLAALRCDVIPVPFEPGDAKMAKEEAPGAYMHFLFESASLSFYTTFHLDDVSAGSACPKF